MILVPSQVFLYIQQYPSKYNKIEDTIIQKYVGEFIGATMSRTINAISKISRGDCCDYGQFRGSK